MPIKVVWFCTTVANPAAEQKREIDALRFLTALKGRRIDGAAVIPVAGQSRRLDNANVDDAIDWFGEMVASYLERQAVAPRFFFVPIPDTTITLESSTGPWTSLLAMGIAAKIAGEVETVDLLRWKTRRPEAGSAPSPWSPEDLYKNLALLRKTAWTKPVILVGHIATGSGPIQACAAALRADGADVILAVFAGRIVSQPAKEPFAVMRAEIEDYHPRGPR